MKEETRIVIGPVRFSYVHVFEPWKADNSGDKPAYDTATLLIPKSDTETLDRVRRAVLAAYEAAVPAKWGGKRPANWWNPLQDGDIPRDNGEDRGEAYHGHYYLNAKTLSRPGVVDARRQPILSSEEFYSGCYGYASVAFGGFSYGNGAKYGVSCYLNNLMKSRDGEPLGGGKTSPEDDFAGINPGDAADDLPFAPGSGDICF